MKWYSLIVFFLFVGCSNKPSIEDLFTTKAERDRFVSEKTQMIDSVFADLPNHNNEKQYQGAFWASELMLKKNEKAQANLKYILNHYSIYSEGFRRATLQHIYTLYATEFIAELDCLLVHERNEKHFAMMANYLIRQNHRTENNYLVAMRNQFSDWINNPILCGFNIEHSVQPILNKTQIEDLIAFRTTFKAPSVFVFVHRNRDIPGVAMILNDRGEFLMDKKDTLKIRMLARSITNMSGYLTNGNTPQGVFCMNGFSSSDNVFIGNSPTIQTALPFEASLSAFCLDSLSVNGWTLEQYEKLFPESWKGYQAKNMAFYAGKAGREEIIIHGTTIDTEFYRQQLYYPFTPSLGCLCSLERWNESNGKLIESEQLKLVNALKRNNIEKALVYVIEQ